MRTSTSKKKVLVAPDSFKGSLSASRVAHHVETGISRAFNDVEVIKRPLSDGGEGLVDSLVTSTGGRMIQTKVTGPLGEQVEAFWGVLGDNKTGVIEMAAASGLTLLPETKRNPAVTTTYGTGELLKEALQYGCQKIIMGLGGSSTNDGGSGMAQALGAKLLDESGREIPFGGKSLSLLHTIDTSQMEPGIKETEILVACDVNNPLTGEQGASFVYGPQKGADADVVEMLDQALKNFSRVIFQESGMNVDAIPGAGAAGGLGAGLKAFTGGKLVPGIELVMEQVNLQEDLGSSDLVITGEGKLDLQSVYGKVPVGVARLAKEWGVPVISLAGEVTPPLEALHREGITSCFSIINQPMSLEEAMASAPELLEMASEEIVRFWVAI